MNDFAVNDFFVMKQINDIKLRRLNLMNHF